MIPDSVTTIGNEAFDYCDSLSGIYVDTNNLSYSNDDRGVLFALTCVSRINKNVTIDQTNLNITTFYVTKILASQDYTIYLKNILLEAKSASTSGESGSIY